MQYLATIGYSPAREALERVMQSYMENQNSDNDENENNNSDNNENQVDTSNDNKKIEAIKKYKELLDLGAITEEEYNKKKKQLLDL